MTEDEAKKKWCPFSSSRVVTTQKSPTEITVNYFGDGKGAATALCIGSQCMAWRGTHHPSGCGTKTPERGYCGIAGNLGDFE